MQVGHALNLVCELPEWLERAPLAKHLRHAAAESFAMNCRVLAEFFWNTAGYRSDIRAETYCGTGWSPGGEPTNLKTPGDKHVAHMTAARVDDPLVDSTSDGRAKIRDELLNAADGFAQAIQDQECETTMTGYVKHARTLAGWPPSPTDEEDPGPFIEAIGRFPPPSSAD